MRVAAFQRRPLFDDSAATTRRIASDLEWCESEGARLAVFPECYLQGYVLDGPTLARLAIALDGPELDRLLREVPTNRVACILGLIERSGGAFFNTAVVIHQGKVVGAYRKTKLHQKETAFHPGDAVPAFGLDDWRFGINICNDANFPEVAGALAVQGAKLICHPLNNMLPPDVADRHRPKSIRKLQRRAAETDCWVVSADVVGAHEDMICHGCTCIVSPTGQIVRRVAEGSEGHVVFDLEP